MTDETLPVPIPAPLSRSQRTTVLNLVRRSARTEILPRWRRLARHEVDEKTGPQDLVTEADHASEAMIARGLLNLFPNALIVGEEEASDKPEMIDRIAEAEMAFTIDPIDGTWNYVHGLPQFGVILSMTRFGRPVFGLLYDPIADDAIVAAEDGRAELLRQRLPAVSLRASSGGAVSDLLGFLPFYMLPQDQRARAAETYTRFGRVWSLRSACHEFRMFAQGHVDFVLSAGLTPWDHAAGALIAARAGGHVAMLDGADYTAQTRQGYLLAASDADTWGRVRDVYAFLLDGQPDMAAQPADPD